MTDEHHVLPASAGMSPSPATPSTPSPSAPRVSGDEPDTVLGWKDKLVCSPRQRG